MQTKHIFLLIAAAAGLYTVMNKAPGSAGPGSATTADKRRDLLNWINANTTDSDATKQRVITAVSQMNDAEIVATWTYVFSFIQQGFDLVQGSALYNEIKAISLKYNIFT